MYNFFYIARAAGLIPLDTASWKDLCYLYYLPFCNVFVSSDKLHRRCAPLFRRTDQEFIWGGDLKNDLISLNNYYSGLPDEIKEKGIPVFANKPPKEPRFLIAGIWDKHSPNWRSKDNAKIEGLDHRSIIEKIHKMNNAPPLERSEVDFDLKDPDSLLIKRPMRKQKGSWRLAIYDRTIRHDIYNLTLNSQSELFFRAYLLSAVNFSTATRACSK